MGTSCAESAQSLLDCMKKTKCMKNGGSVVECLKNKEESDPCKELYTAYFTCRRSGLDMRSRIRGPRVH